MATFKTGFVGCGNMASAIIKGIQNQKTLPAADIFVYDIDAEKCAAMGDVNVCASISELAERAQVIFLCVKPNIVEAACREIKETGRAVISIAAGVKAEKIAAMLPEGTRVMRIMPNTPMMLGMGAISIQTPNDLTADEKSFVYGILGGLGMLAEVRAHDMDAVTGVSGSGPAYVYLFIDAVAAAGEANGLDRKTAQELAVKTFEGACAMLRSAGKTPQQLIKDVCSPGGTTLEAMKVFEERDVRGIIDEAVSACVRRSKELSE